MYELCMVIFLLSTLGGVIAGGLFFLSLIKKSMKNLRMKTLLAMGIFFALWIGSALLGSGTEEAKALNAVQNDSSPEMDYLAAEGTEDEETAGTEVPSLVSEGNPGSSKEENTEDAGQTENGTENETENPAGNETDNATENADMEVHFIDVGQGDATLIKSDGHYMLIDAGENDKGTLIQNYLRKQGVDKLDYLVLTHTDADHIGGADVIINKFAIDNLFLGDYKKDNKTYGELMDAIAYKNLTYSTPAVGAEYQLGNAVFTIVAPNGTYSDPNNSSIALMLQNGNNSFLFTGDCEEEAEEDILRNGINIDCDVYKLGHHGSRTASSRAFLDVITPVYGVVSCQEDNSYGHPHAEPLNNLREMGVMLFRTDEQGSIVAYSDGEEITWNCAPSDTWKAGEPTGSSDVSGVGESGAEQSPEQTTGITEDADTESGSNPTGESELAADPTAGSSQAGSIIANVNTKAFHRPDCSRLPKEKNRVYFDSREEAMAAGYDNPCDYCNP